MTGPRKLEPPLRLEMDFGEALSRFVTTKPEEIEASIVRAKTKRPPGNDPPRRPERPKRQTSKRP